MVSGGVKGILVASVSVSMLFLCGELGLMSFGTKRLEPGKIRASGRPRPPSLSSATPSPTPRPLPPRTTTTTPPAPARPPEALDPSTVELVIASYCENKEWFKPYPGPITIYSKKASCTNELREAVAAAASRRGRVEELRNWGREGHTYISHIVNNWCNLAPYTAFVQGKGEHNGVQVIDFLMSFLANSAPGAKRYGPEPPPPPVFPGEELAVVPILHRNQKGYILYRDKEEEEAKGGMDTKTNVHVFGVPPEYVEKQRLLYTLMYGGSVCDVPPMVFPAGAQFIVHRNAIHSKPLSFWKQMLVEFDRWVNMGYYAEREWLYMFDPTKTLTSWGQDCFRLPALFWGPQYHTWRCPSGSYAKYRGPQDLVHGGAGVLAPTNPKFAPEPSQCEGGTLKEFKYSKDPDKSCGLCAYIEVYKELYKGGADEMVRKALEEVEKATGGSLDCASRRLFSNTSNGWG